MSKSFETILIRTSSNSVSRDVELGEFQTVWKDGVSIGSDPGCTISLPDLPPVAARVVAMSNHKLLYRLPVGTSFPLPPVSSLGPYDQRVDHREFEVGLHNSAEFCVSRKVKTAVDIRQSEARI